jgi:xylan 1,4-beta-xylosidase
VYGNEKSEDVFGTHEVISQHDMVARSVRKVYDEVKHSARPDLPIFWSEYNATYANDPAITDSAFMGPWLANNIRMCDGLTTLMSYWTFSDVFEEQGIVRTPFYGGFGLIAAGGIPKAAFNAFVLLHKLGDKRIDVDSDSVLATVRADGSLVIAVWNYAEPQETGKEQTITLQIKGLSGHRQARITTVDPEHGSALGAWEKMGRPATPSRDQLAQLRQAAMLPPSTRRGLGTGGQLELVLAPKALTLVEVTK